MRDVLSSGSNYVLSTGLKFWKRIDVLSTCPYIDFIWNYISNRIHHAQLHQLPHGLAMQNCKGGGKCRWHRGAAGGLWHLADQVIRAVFGVCNHGTKLEVLAFAGPRVLDWSHGPTGPIVIRCNGIF